LREWINNLEGEDIIPVKDFKRSFNTACRNAGLIDVTFHTLRHTAASYLVMGGVDLAAVKEILGHATIQMTMRYSHLSPDHRKKAVKILQNQLDI